MSGKTPSEPKTTCSGTPLNGPLAASAPRPQTCGVRHWKSTLATSADFAATGRSRMPLIDRSYRSIATVSSVLTHRIVTGSIANTSSL